jgi:hypothetical protein
LSRAGSCCAAGAARSDVVYKAFEAAIIADYDAQSAVERELVLRLASLLWRLRRATTMETGLFEIQAEHLREFKHARQVQPASRKIVYTMQHSTIRRATIKAYEPLRELPGFLASRIEATRPRAALAGAHA